MVGSLIAVGALTAMDVNGGQLRFSGGSFGLEHGRLEKFEMKFITPTDQLALIDARRAGRVEGREEGRVEGREEGRVEGREEGRVEGIELGVRSGQLRELRESIFEIADARLGPRSSEWVERIQSIDSIEVLTALRRRLLRAESWSEIPLP